MISVVVGMQSEARLVQGCPVVCSGGDPDRALALAERLLADGAAGLVSLGIAGGLAPHLRPGDLVVASGVAIGSTIVATDATWLARMRHVLGDDALVGTVYAAREAAATPADKRRLHAGGQVVAVDLESGAVAQACVKAGKPFAVLRTIADPADRSIPRLALSALGPDGRPLIGRVVAGLMKRPGDLPGLIKVGFDSSAALRSLDRAVRRLGPTLGFEPS